MPEPPPRQHKHGRQYTPSRHSVISTGQIWKDDHDGQMILGYLGCLKFPDICLTGEEILRENLAQEICPDRGSNPGPLRDKRACYHLLHSGGHRSYRGPQSIPILSKFYPVSIITTLISQIYFNIILRPESRPPLRFLSFRTSLRTLYVFLDYFICATCPAHLNCLD